ncbi:MAG: ATP-binding protein [Chitinophagales bacterium]|nr:ATP-binding protein [Chitinophagales bacterium]
MRFRPNIKTNWEDLYLAIAKGENSTQDFKQTISDSKKIARTLAAFANNKGGDLLVGINDFGKVIGCDVEENMYMLHEAAEHLCDPPINIDFTVYEDEDLNVLIASVSNSLKKPHFALDDNDAWQLYMRSNDKTVISKSINTKYLEKNDSYVLDSKEQAVLEYLNKYEYINTKIVMQLLNLSERRAKRMLTSLWQNGYLIKQEQYFVLNGV